MILEQIKKKSAADEFEVEYNEQKLGTKINITMTSDDNALCLGMAKIAYNAAHYFIGESWTTEDKLAHEFRENLVAGNADYFKSGMMLGSEAVAKLDLPFGCEPGFHDVALLPTPGGNSILVSLFGQGLAVMFKISNQCHLLQAMMRRSRSMHVRLNLETSKTILVPMAETWKSIQT